MESTIDIGGATCVVTPRSTWDYRSLSDDPASLRAGDVVRIYNGGRFADLVVVQTQDNTLYLMTQDDRRVLAEALFGDRLVIAAMDEPDNYCLADAHDHQRGVTTEMYVTVGWLNDCERGYADLAARITGDKCSETAIPYIGAHGLQLLIVTDGAEKLVDCPPLARATAMWNLAFLLDDIAGREAFARDYNAEPVAV